MFTIPSADGEDSPWPIFERLLKSHEELAELDGLLDQGLRIAFMMRSGEWTQNTSTLLGMCYCQPSAQGQMRQLFEQLLEDVLGFYPDWLIVLNHGAWDSMDEKMREVLVFHEALHARQATDKFGSPRFNRITGMPVPAIRSHDIEEFNAVVARYGAWKPDIADFARALARGEAKVSQRESKARVF